MDIKRVVGKRIKDFRKLRGFTQDKLAEVVGIDTISLSKIETGRNYPTAENIKKLSEALGANIYEFFVSDNIKTNEELLTEIYSNLPKISKDNHKLHVLVATIRNLL